MDVVAEPPITAVKEILVTSRANSDTSLPNKTPNTSLASTFTDRSISKDRFHSNDRHHVCPCFPRYRQGGERRMCD
jgi:hypothetical protein